MDQKICRICLRIGAKVYKFDKYRLKFYYEEVLASKVNDHDGLPQFFCYECAMMLHKFHKFKEKSFTGQKLLKEMLSKGPISYEAVKKIDRIDYGLQPIISLSTADRGKVFVFYESNMKPQIIDSTIDTIAVDDSSTEDEWKEDDPLSDGFEMEEDEASADFNNVSKVTENVTPCVEMKIAKKPSDDETSKTEHGMRSMEGKLEKQPRKRPAKTGARSKGKQNNNDGEGSKRENEIPFLEGTAEKEPIKRPAKTQSERKRKQNNSDGATSNFRKELLTSEHWEVVTMNDEEAEKAFKEREASSKYIEAPYKCTKCFNGYSKEIILKRHIKIRHTESTGKTECGFCHRRYKTKSALMRHMRQHYVRYKCLRCSLVCDLETTAILHNEFHSGVVKKCKYCGEEYRHTSSYYSHLRRHRSEFVCALCGVSFVSAAGLQQHKLVTHVVDQGELEDDDEAPVTYCARCDIRFETSKAYREHLFHSVMHAEEATEKMKDGETIPDKIVDKDLQNKNSDDLQLPSVKEDTLPRNTYKKKQWGRKRKNKKIPTTCRQCGKSFETQMACMKHHVSEHPRTPYYTERVICEICGASLALVSVASHRNMHTKEVMHSCATCGRQFHSSVSFKRHQLTHTGAKPYGCTLCDKRFTQGNSLKLHYRTIHLKQPYPKRNRRKKTDMKKPLEPVSQTTDEESEDSRGPVEPPGIRTRARRAHTAQ